MNGQLLCSACESNVLMSHHWAGNDFWLFDDSIVVFTVFTGKGDVFERQLTTDPAAIQLCRSAFEATWTIAIPHSEYRPS